MPNLNDLKQSKYLTKEDVGRGVLATIQAYQQVNVALDGQPPEMKWALTFLEDLKPLVLNQVNGETIAEIAKSEEFDDWAGTKIVLYNDPTVKFGIKTIGGIRVRAPKGQATVPPPVDDLPF